LFLDAGEGLGIIAGRLRARPMRSLCLNECQVIYYGEINDIWTFGCPCLAEMACENGPIL